MRWRCWRPLSEQTRHFSIVVSGFPAWGLMIVIFAFSGLARGMSRARIESLQQEAIDMFYHGYDNYLDIAFPDDELRPVTCQPLTRDPEHPERFGINDVLGNYSLTLVDTLSTLAVLASTTPARQSKRPSTALEDFQNGVQLIVKNYGDGGDGLSGQGIRARGFDLDSKVQLFETVIRGVGGLLSSHLFAIGDLPILGYNPTGHSDQANGSKRGALDLNSTLIARWSNGFQYNGQLLRLAHDLGKRLLPAFHTATGIPYPRVNLKYGIPFYPNSLLYGDTGTSECGIHDLENTEITETCSAGAGSLILEFVTLSRLTGDGRFEQVAKRAFWEVWNRRSDIDLISGGIDPESGLWTSAMTGIGAGVDSFFEYAFKSHILLSGIDPFNTSQKTVARPSLSQKEKPGVNNDSDEFLGVWKVAHAAIKRQLYRDVPHPHYLNVHHNTGSAMTYWVDSLSAYYPGLLTLAGELDEAIATNLLYTALWTRFSALPERWSLLDGSVEGGLGWWPGRPELAESNYHLYRATKDPWYLYVGEMILKDIQRRCWTACGWAGLQDVRTGELSDRMESFFLGETTKYLLLLFDEDHPLNKLDAPYVFSTEGHPLLIRKRDNRSGRNIVTKPDPLNGSTCPVPPKFVPLTLSAVAAREDLFHAAHLARLFSTPRYPARAEGHQHSKELSCRTMANVPVANNRFPWTLPPNLMPFNGTSRKLKKPTSFEIWFPISQPSMFTGRQSIIRAVEGLLVTNLEGLKLSFTQDEGSSQDSSPTEKGQLRVYSVAGVTLGRDEKVYIKREAFKDLVDPNFSRVPNDIMADLYVQLKEGQSEKRMTVSGPKSSRSASKTARSFRQDSQGATSTGSGRRGTHNVFSAAIQQISALGTALNESQDPTPVTGIFQRLAAISATGTGACPLPETGDFPDLDGLQGAAIQLPWTSLYLADESCHEKLPEVSAMDHQIIVIRRGGCSFSQKLANIPIFRASKESLQLVVIVSDGDADSRPLLDQVQYTPAGLPRFTLIPTVMVGGGQTTYDLLARAKAIGLRSRYHVLSQGVSIRNVIVI